MEREKPALHAQGSIFRQKLVPLFNVESHAQAEACVVYGEPVVIFHNCTLPNRTIEQLGHGRGIEARTFAIGQGAQEETTFIVHSNGTMPVLRHLKPNGWKGAFIRKERGLILPDTCKRLCHRYFALLASVAMRVESKVLIVAFFCMLVSSFLQRIIEQIFFESRNNIAQGCHDAAFIRAAIQTEAYPKKGWHQKKFVDIQTSFGARSA